MSRVKIPSSSSVYAFPLIGVKIQSEDLRDSALELLTTTDLLSPCEDFFVDQIDAGESPPFQVVYRKTKNVSQQSQIYSAELKMRYVNHIFGSLQLFYNKDVTKQWLKRMISKDQRRLVNSFLSSVDSLYQKERTSCSCDVLIATARRSKTDDEYEAEDILCESEKYIFFLIRFLQFLRDFLQQKQNILDYKVTFQRWITNKTTQHEDENIENVKQEYTPKEMLLQRMLTQFENIILQANDVLYELFHLSFLQKIDLQIIQLRIRNKRKGESTLFGKDSISFVEDRFTLMTAFLKRLKQISIYLDDQSMLLTKRRLLSQRIPDDIALSIQELTPENKDAQNQVNKTLSLEPKQLNDFAYPHLDLRSNKSNNRTYNISETVNSYEVPSRPDKVERRFYSDIDFYGRRDGEYDDDEIHDNSYEKGWGHERIKKISDAQNQMREEEEEEEDEGDDVNDNNSSSSSNSEKTATNVRTDRDNDHEMKARAYVRRRPL